MKRLFQPGKTRIPFMACWCATIFCLLFALTALVVAKTPTRTVSTASQSTQVTIVPPFVGTHSETWERFPIQSIPSGTSILGGIATISGPNLEIDGPQMFTLCGHGLYAQPSDGIRLLGAAYPSGPVTISFSQPVSAFGAYWGGVPLECEGSSIVLTFRDANSNQIGTDSFAYTGDGTLQWHGYTFATPVKTITRD